MEALVTGASSGIGRELARVIAADGHHVTVVARRAEVLEELSAALGGARVVAVDLADPAAPAAVHDAVPQVDILVNNAGFGDFGAFAERDLARQLEMIDVNVRALTELTHRYLGGMLSRGHGRIMNVASTASFQPGPLMATYYATKAYVLSFSEALHEETRSTGVSVTAACPGPTASGFQAASGMEENPLVAGRRLPSAAEVAYFGYRAMLQGRAVAVPGTLNRTMAASVRFAPRPVIRRVVHRMQRPGRH